MNEEVLRRRVDVPAEPAGYDVICGRGALAMLPGLLAEVLPVAGSPVSGSPLAGAPPRVVVCTDSTVAALHGERALSILREGGYEALLWTMPAGERHKTLETVAAAYAWLAERRVERADTIVALGGGVVGDLAGFVAATYLRGLRLLQAPTTLVAQVDSALGGKVGVDLPAGKNLVGAFHQPALVLADTDLLATLPEREWRAGLAEVLKHGLIRDPGLLELLQRRRADVLARDPDLVASLVDQAAAVKIDVVVADPLERGLRRILNYGHTLGHAIERAAGYGVVLHGEAVAWGIAAAARIGAALGTCEQSFVAWQDGLLRDYGLLVPLPPLDADAIVAATRLDKKSVAGRINWVLPCAPGSATVRADVPAAAVHDAIAWLVNNRGE